MVTACFKNCFPTCIRTYLTTSQHHRQTWASHGICASTALSLSLWVQSCPDACRATTPQSTLKGQERRIENDREGTCNLQITSNYSIRNLSRCPFNQRWRDWTELRRCISFISCQAFSELIDLEFGFTKTWSQKSAQNCGSWAHDLDTHRNIGRFVVHTTFKARERSKHIQETVTPDLVCPGFFDHGCPAGLGGLYWAVESRFAYL